MSLQETQSMIDRAIAEGMRDLEDFEKIYEQFPEDEKTEQTEIWLLRNGAPAIKPKCTSCGERFPYQFPLVVVDAKGNVNFKTGDDFKQYFNQSPKYRFCIRCEAVHPKV